MIIFTVCTDPDRGIYCAFCTTHGTNRTTKHEACGMSRAEAVGFLVCQMADPGKLTAISEITEIIDIEGKDTQ